MQKDDGEIWSETQVYALNRYQRSGRVHPFTGERGPDGEETLLIATRRGWVEREGGPVVQKWAHAFMLDGCW